MIVTPIPVTPFLTPLRPPAAQSGGAGSVVIMVKGFRWPKTSIYLPHTPHKHSHNAALAKPFAHNRRLSPHDFAVVPRVGSVYKAHEWYVESALWPTARL